MELRCLEEQESNMNMCLRYPKTVHLTAVGFEPTPPKRLVPKTSALDHSATLPFVKRPYSTQIFSQWTLLENQVVASCCNTLHPSFHRIQSSLHVDDGADDGEHLAIVDLLSLRGGRVLLNAFKIKVRVNFCSISKFRLGELTSGSNHNCVLNAPYQV